MRRIFFLTKDLLFLFPYFKISIVFLEAIPHTVKTFLLILNLNCTQSSEQNCSLFSVKRLIKAKGPPLRFLKRNHVKKG